MKATTFLGAHAPARLHMQPCLNARPSVVALPSLRQAHIVHAGNKIGHVCLAVAVRLLSPPECLHLDHSPIPAGFDEGAAQVRRLLDRDRKELDFDQLEKTFAAEGEEPTAAPDAQQLDSPSRMEATPSNSGALFAADKTPMSPFGPSTTTPANPFAGSAPSRKPFSEPAGLSPTMQPDAIEQVAWWRKITLTQVVIVLSFTTIISLMIATFFVVVQMGGVRFNE